MGGNNGDDPMSEDPHPTLRLDEHATPSELARAYATIAAGYYSRIPEIAAAVERIEAACLVADGAAHRAEIASRRAINQSEGLERTVKKLDENVTEIRGMVHTMEMRLTGAEDDVSKVRKEMPSTLDLVEQAKEANRILQEAAKNPDNKMTSDRAKAIAKDMAVEVLERAKQEAATEGKLAELDKIHKARDARKKFIWGLVKKGAGALAGFIALAVGGALWGQCQRAVGKAEGMAEATQHAAPAVPPNAVATASVAPPPAPAVPAAASPAVHR